MSRTIGPKQALFAQLALTASALASAARLELLDFLAQSERSVDELAKLTGLSVANTSKHLQQLRRVGLVQGRRDGLHVIYSVAGDDVIAAVVALRELAESRLAEVDRIVASYLASKDGLEPVSSDELMARADEGLVTLLDVRPPEEYAREHLPGAVNVPLAELKSHLAGLPKEREVVAYCRGPWCVLSFEAVQLLRAAGFQARRLEVGLPEWRHAGRPTDRGR
jgi:rhodanese-related sulfurtransferase/DNA-binding transcriptional ArsR family regulator